MSYLRNYLLIYNIKLELLIKITHFTGKLNLCDTGKHSTYSSVRLEECSDEEEEADTGSEDGGQHKDQIAKTVTSVEKDTTKEVKCSTMQQDQEVPNVLVRLVT